MIGTVIDGCYRVDDLLGEGQFGVVYRCADLQLEKHVALKMLNSNKAGERELSQFVEEARKLARVNHPNVVHVYRLGRWEGHHYMAMEFIQGKTLRDFIQGERLPLRAALTAMRQAAAGLQAMHAMNIIHRDLSTNNIMLTDSGTTKIVDLGLAKDLARLSSTVSQNLLVGTLAYIAPELVEGGSATVRSEIFSYGVILYEVLAGRNPFQAEHYMSLLYNITQREPEPLEMHVRPCPPGLSAVVSRCLEKRPEDRPADMAEVERALDEVMARPEIDSAARVHPAVMPVGARQTPGNPYLNRVMIKRPDDFIGRRQEVKRIFARLNATPPGSVSIVGDRKIGKSSLLNYIYMRQQRQQYLELPEKMVMVFLDLQEEKNMSMESFVRIMLGITGYELRGRLDVSDCALSLDGVKDMVQRLEGAGFRLAILLDEFDTVTTNPNFDLEFFSFLRFLAGHYNVAYLTSSARDLQALCHTKEISDSPFFNIFSTIRLSVLQRAEAEELIRVPSERAGQPLGTYTDQILGMAGFFPFFIQMACAHAFEYMEENPGQEKPDFNEIRRRFYEEARLHYRYIWDTFDSHERSTVLRVVKRKDVPDALKHVLQELGTRHYIESDHASPRVFASTFEEFVKAEGQEPGKKSLFEKLLGR
jgi:serine/threonine protein kinase